MTDIALRERAATYRIFAGICICLSVSVLVPILLAGRPCNDDLARAVNGAYGWVDNGRYLSNLLMRVLQLGASRAVDIAPIPQFLAVLAVSCAGVLLVRRFEIASLPLGILVALPLGTQPFFLQNLSYRFDAATMGAAVLCAVGAIALCNGRRRDWCWGVVALLATFNLYQPAFNVFLVLAIFEIAFEAARACRGRGIVRLAGFRCSQAIVAAFAYHVLFTGGMKSWVADHGETIHSLNALPLIGTNLVGFLGYVRDALGGKLSWIFLVVTLAAALPMIALGIRRAWREQSMADATLRTVFLLMWPALGLLASIGPMLLLLDPVFAPRVFPAIGAFICATLISAAHIAQRSQRLRFIPYAAGLVCVVVSSITAGAYSSAASEQTKFEDRIAATTQDDLAQLKSTSHVSTYVIVGSAGYAPAVRHAISQFPIIERLIVSYLTQDQFLTQAYLRHFSQALTLIDTAQLTQQQRDAAFDPCAAPIALTRTAFRIRIADELAIVDMRGPAPCGK